MTKLKGEYSKNPLICDKCKCYMYIENTIHTIKKEKTIIYRLPVYICKSCISKFIFIPIEDKRFYKKICENETKILFSFYDNDYLKKDFSIYNNLQFKYEPFDYYIIPGLYREWDDGHLIPVFFDKDLLLYYINHPDYYVYFYSFSSGGILYKGEDLFPRGFGINRNGKVFFWLGDLFDILSKEKNINHLRRFQASNIESDHDVISDYYFNQIEVCFTEADNEYKLFQEKVKFEKLILKNFNLKILNFDITSLSNRYKFPILDAKDQIFSSYEELNKYLLENINKDILKQFLISKGIESDKLNGLGSIKLLEIFCENILKLGRETKKIISPLYVLYDLRILKSHLSANTYLSKYNSCKERLGCKVDISDFEFYQEVINSLINFYKNINDILNNINH